MIGPTTFTYWFAPVMLLTPVAWVLAMELFRPVRPAPFDKGIAALYAGLIVGTAVPVGLWFGGVATQAGVFAIMYWALFFPLWFGLAMPLTARRFPATASAHPEGVPVRAASLAPRSGTPAVPDAAWRALRLLWAGGLVAVCLAPFGEARWWIAVACYAVLLPVPLMGPWLTRLMAVEAEPLPEGGSEEFAQEYRKLRLFRARGLFALTAVLGVVAGSALCLLAHGIDGRWLGIAGGAAGSVIGVAGAAFGATAGLRRARLTERLTAPRS